jgi:hypothetical protein
MVNLDKWPIEPNAEAGQMVDLAKWLAQPNGEIAKLARW